MEFDLLGSLSPRGSGAAPAGPGSPQCSRKGCRADAAWQIRWNNPRIHAPERRKVWLACPEHRADLEQFLGARGFWKDTVPFAAGSADGDPAAQERR